MNAYWLIIDGESWIVHPFVPNTNNKTRRFMGMGGRIMEAVSNDGRKTFPMIGGIKGKSRKNLRI